MRWYQKFQSVFLKYIRDRKEDPRITEFLKSTLANISGLVVEVGPGAGTNFKYLASGIQWVGIEPNREVNNLLIQEAKKYGLSNIKVVNSNAEKMEVPNNSCDVVLATRVLCSAGNPGEVVKEIYRILKPGGKYIFLEHVAAPQGTIHRFIQNIFNPLNRIMVGNCHINRENGKIIERTGFSNLSLSCERAMSSIGPLPYIWGVAIK